MGLSAYHADITLPDLQFDCQKCDQSIIGLPIDRRCIESYFQRIPDLSDDFSCSRARLHVDSDAQTFCLPMTPVMKHYRL